MPNPFCFLARLIGLDSMNFDSQSEEPRMAEFLCETFKMMPPVPVAPEVARLAFLARDCLIIFLIESYLRESFKMDSS